MPKIEAIRDDITKQEVSAIVNAAHEALKGGGGVDGAIHRAAGPQLIQECMKFPSRDGVRCKTGEAKTTLGYKLPAKYVIHTVAPKFVGFVDKGIYKSKNTGVDLELANCYKNSLIEAERVQAESIAFPSLGTGGHAYPIELACPIAVNAVKQYFSDNHETSIKTVRFVCFLERDYQLYFAMLED
jgi:O-acetyl-ADP-ribose deacetylase (regulator of RNase III)